MPSRDYYLPERQLVSQGNAEVLERTDVPRSRFINEYTRKMTFDASFLVPFLVEEILPGDHMKYDVTAYLRMATPYFPLFDNQRIDTFFFFVPNRLVWDNWTRFMGEQPTGPLDSIAFTVPRHPSPAGGFGVGTLQDHMGLPTVGQVTAGQVVENVCAFPMRGYYEIYRTWFRDQNNVSLSATDKGNGPDTAANYVLLRRAKPHDYFTTCMPSPGKFGVASVRAPLIGNSPVTGIGLDTAYGFPGPAAPVAVRDANFPNTGAVGYGNSAPLATAGLWFANTAPSYPLIQAELAFGDAGLDMNALRLAMAIQVYNERDMRGGTRYTEMIFNHFGVRSPDMRLQRPEYIGGGSTPLSITPIAQTAPTAGQTVGYLGAAASGSGSHRASYAATEHGYIIGLINVRTEVSYQQGLQRHWTRQNRTDFYVPALAQLGEQAVLRQEIFCTGTDALDANVFGYQERWHELRTRYSDVTGLFRSTSAGTIHQWHFAEFFTAFPFLGPTFINDQVSGNTMNRVLAAGSLEAGKQYLADILIRREATRAVPMFGTPVGFGRF